MTYDQALRYMFPPDEWSISAVTNFDHVRHLIDPDTRVLRNVIRGDRYVYYPHRDHDELTGRHLSDEKEWVNLPFGLRYFALTATPPVTYETAARTPVQFLLVAYNQWRDVQRRVATGDFSATHQVDRVLQRAALLNWSAGTWVDEQVRAALGDEADGPFSPFQEFLASYDPYLRFDQPANHR